MKSKKLLNNISNFNIQGDNFGWGRKKSGVKASQYKKYTLLEDGFIRSVGLGVEGYDSFSIVKDNKGIFYDATTTSQLEYIINNMEVHYKEPLVTDAYLYGSSDKITLNIKNKNKTFDFHLHSIFSNENVEKQYYNIFNNKISKYNSTNTFNNSYLNNTFCLYTCELKNGSHRLNQIKKNFLNKNIETKNIIDLYFLKDFDNLSDKNKHLKYICNLFNDYLIKKSYVENGVNISPIFVKMLRNFIRNSQEYFTKLEKIYFNHISSCLKYSPNSSTSLFLTIIENIEKHGSKFEKKQLENYFKKSIKLLEEYDFDSLFNQILEKIKINQVLIISQTKGDLSLEYGYGNKFTTQDMISDAILENPYSNIYLKIHPDVLSGKKESDIDIDNIPKEITLITEDINPIQLLSQMDIVYTKTSGMGLEALLMGIEVKCYGVPFYASWGLTHDKYRSNSFLLRRHRKNVTTKDLFVAFYLIYSEYCIPYKKQKSSDLKKYYSNHIMFFNEEKIYKDKLKETFSELCEDSTLHFYDFDKYIGIKEVVPYIIKYREIEEKKEHRVFLFGFSFWKQKYIKYFLTNYKEDNIIFINPILSSYEKLIKSNNITINDNILFWGHSSKYSNIKKTLIAKFEKENTPINTINVFLDNNFTYVEDGFIRSVGLGSDLTQPFSLIFDKKGMYFDPFQDSDLEKIIIKNVYERISNNTHIDIDLFNIWKKNKITKYNSSLKCEKEYSFDTDKDIVLIIGQVEDDYSIKTGGLGMTNTELIRNVKKDYPNSYLIYKPHPDVTSGNRIGIVENIVIEQYIDETIIGGNIHELINKVNKLCTITSLTGFEGLMINESLEVICYGIPFYSGWGLTIDKFVHKEIKNKRGGKNFDINELGVGISFRSTSFNISNEITRMDIFKSLLIDYPRYISIKDNKYCEMNVLVDNIIEESNKNNYPLLKIIMNTRNIISRKIQFYIKSIKNIIKELK